MYKLSSRAHSEIPVLETARLRLRPPRIEDFEAALALWQDPVFLPHVGGTPRMARQIWTNLQSYIGSWALLGYGFLVIADRKSDAFIGECGFFTARRDDITPPLPLIPEAGWGIAPKYWGKGLMTEAMTAMMDWALEQDPDFPCQCIINPGHVPSERIALNLGFRLVRSVRFGSDNINVYERRSADGKHAPTVA